MSDANDASTQLGVTSEGGEASAGNGVVDGEEAAKAAEHAALRAKYPLKVLYCEPCGLPGELCGFNSKAQFEKCKPWLASNCPELYPDIFPADSAAQRDAPDAVAEKPSTGVPVAVPIEQKTSGGKKKKTPAEVILAIGQRKGKKQVTICYGLDLFGIKLKLAAKAAKRKFATGSSVTTSPDSREVVEIQGNRQTDFAQLVHTEFGVPKEAIFIITTGKKKVPAFK